MITPEASIDCSLPLASDALTTPCHWQAREASRQLTRELHEAKRGADRVADQLRTKETEAAQLKSLVSRMEQTHTELSSRLDASVTRGSNRRPLLTATHHEDPTGGHSSLPGAARQQRRL